MSIRNRAARRARTRLALSTACLGGSVLLGLASVAPAQAEPATAEGARKLAETFQGYVGPLPFEKGFLAIEPKGESYELTVRFDSDKLDQPASEGRKERASITPYTLRLTPKTDGTWALDGAPQPLAMAWTADGAGGSETLALTYAGCTSQGVFDPKLMAFATLAAECATATATARTPDADVDLATGKLGFRNTSKADGAGGVDVQFEASLAGLKGKAQDRKPGTQTPPIAFELGSGRQSLAVKGIRIGAIADLAAFLHDHPTKGAIALAQDELKAKLRAALPVWQEVSSSTRIENISVELPFGTARLAHAEEKQAVTGLVKQGYYADALSYSGLEIPTAAVPEWARPLIPAEASYATGLSLSGLDGIADVLIRGLDATQDPPFSKTMVVALVTRLFASDLTYKLGLDVKAPAFTVKAEGRGAINPEPQATLSVSASGFDKVMDSLGKADEPDARQAVGFLSFVKGLAKEGAEGRLVWDVSYDVVTNSVKVNDQVFPLPQPD